jgi:hypothetical protein
MSSKTSTAKGRVVIPTPRDNSSFMVPNTTGREMGGGADNIEHSLKGARANMQGGASSR